jgi:hypothetical protein
MNGLFRPANSMSQWTESGGPSKLSSPFHLIPLPGPRTTVHTHASCW